MATIEEKIDNSMAKTWEPHAHFVLYIYGLWQNVIRRKKTPIEFMNRRTNNNRLKCVGSERLHTLTHSHMHTQREEKSATLFKS